MPDLAQRAHGEPVHDIEEGNIDHYAAGVPFRYPLQERRS